MSHTVKCGTPRPTRLNEWLQRVALCSLDI